MVKLLVVVGTRPEAIKMAPIIKCLRALAEFRAVVVATAQHREMLDQVLELFGITPDHDLDIMAPGQSLTYVTAMTLERVGRVLELEKPDAVLVQGDTTTTFGAALAAFYRRTPVFHVEAGLRTNQRYDPFPEELNRRLTTHLAELHLAPTDVSRRNLLLEGVDTASIHVTGNPVIDALLSAVRPGYAFRDPALAEVDFCSSRVILVTTHRRENFGEPMKRVYGALKTILGRVEDVRVVFSVHKNPAVRAVANAELAGLARVYLVEPVDYLEFANLMSKSYLIMTDSGGVQEEAPSLGKPVLVLRDTTERPEGLSAGTLKLVGTHTGRIVDEAMKLLTDPAQYSLMAHRSNPYGDGCSAGRIVEVLRYHFKLRKTRPEEFRGGAR
ncbi:MAG: UDP-N-acetylglucosamine 2-epimerase (non-hydrolyzing) [Firmicutes bacterium]|nr:UDP-N-acetylglucosamine 2-epimerase (non-hydrolyzing) [Bacillota bacterium]